MSPNELAKVLDAHRRWWTGGPDGKRADLQGADLQGADLQGAYLRGADLRRAYLRGADLQGAYLQGAYLRGAYLRGAYLRRADLRRAYLRGADLQGADLQGAYLRGADLRGATTWEDVLAMVPELLGAGGRPLHEVVTRETLSCHLWSNCPTAAAFGAESLGEVPLRWRPWAELFIDLFDSKALSPEAIAQACNVELPPAEGGAS